MEIFIPDPKIHTLLFHIIFTIILIFSIRPWIKSSFIDISLTNELKGLAILSILFGHIGLFLAHTDEFLHPLSILSGVGVNIFLVLSGFGLSISQIQNPITILGFYQKRLTRLFLPLWIVITMILTVDLLILNKIYSIQTVIQSYLGFFPNADVALDLNSPLWYFSFILFYYLIFPLIFFKNYPAVSAVLIFLVSLLAVNLPLPIDLDVLKLYQVHILAFPLGILIAWIITSSWFLTFKQKVANWVEQIFSLKHFKTITTTLLLFPVSYFAINSKVGSDIVLEQLVSTVMVGLLLLIFLLKNIKLQILEVFGKYSYEIYLLHWPILSRYDLFYQFLPPWLATLVYLATFLVLGFLLNKFVNFFYQRSYLANLLK